LIDTSVLIDSLRGRSNAKSDAFKELVISGSTYGFSAYTIQETLQGARDEAEFERLKSYLLTQRILCLPETAQTYAQAGRMFFDLRRRGITVRSSIDILIALTAICHGAALLHNDHDFDVIAENLPELVIY
jgi:predicted nucleic acid-binding protein